jgi:lipid-binding SYLF domain-containing protein
MRGSIFAFGTLLAGALALTQSMPAQELQQRLNQSAEVLSQMTGTQGATIPPQVLDRARCIVVIPNMKSGAFLVGAEYGKGFASCRTVSGWSAPAPFAAEGGSIGLQAGGQEQDLVLLLMDDNARSELLQNNLKLGATASVEAGSTTAKPKETNADVLAYSHSNGIFAGASVNGVSIHADSDALPKLYGPNVTANQVLEGQVAPPPQARQFDSTLNRASGGR